MFWGGDGNCQRTTWIAQTVCDERVPGHRSSYREGAATVRQSIPNVAHSAVSTDLLQTKIGCVAKFIHVYNTLISLIQGKLISAKLCTRYAIPEILSEARKCSFQIWLYGSAHIANTCKILRWASTLRIDPWCTLWRRNHSNSHTCDLPVWVHADVRVLTAVCDLPCRQR